MSTVFSRASLKHDPFHQFECWFEEAQAAERPYPGAMSVATASALGEVSSRMVMLRYFDKGGFVFFSSYDTLTAQQIEQNPQVSLLFFWSSLDRQVKVVGTAVKLPTAESLHYFASRHKNSQMGAWLSQSSGVVASKSILKGRWAAIKRQFRDGQPSMPDLWGGYRVAPHTIEFWQGQTDGLHDRFVYVHQNDNAWDILRLAP